MAGAIVVVAVLLLTSGGTLAASSRTQFENYFPANDGCYYQNLETHGVDPTGHMEVAMTANVASLTKDASNFQRTAKVSVQVLANTRLLAGYSNTQGSPDNWGTGSMENPINSKNFADNEGKWVTSSNPIAFYGSWYTRIYITTNGFVALGADPSKIVDGTLPDSSWVNPPSSIPSTSAPRGMAIVAPFWRDLSGGTISWGEFNNKDGTPYSQEGTFFWVKWANMGCAGTTAKQTFAVVFPEGTYYQYVTLLYGSVTPTAGPATVAGCQDHSGVRGNSLSGLFSVSQVTNKWAVLWPNNPDNYYFVSHVKITATKLTASGANDVNSYIKVQQVENALPTGTNLEIDPNHPDPQTPDTSILTGIGWGLDILGLFLPPPANFLVPFFGGMALDVTSAYYSSWAIPPYAIYGDGNTWDTCAYTDNPVKEYHGMSNGISGLAWDVAAYPEFVWNMIESDVASSTHVLSLTAVVNMMYPVTFNLDGSPRTWATAPVNLGPLVVKFDPSPSGSGSDATYTSRTYPDSHYLDFWRMNPSSEGVSPPSDLNFAYEVSGYYRPAADYNYDIFGLTTPSSNSNDQVKVRYDGSVRTEGYFRGYDYYPAGDARDSLLAYLLPMRPEYGNDYAKMVRGTPTEFTILGSGETDWSWHFKGNTLNAGTSLAGVPVKVGIGRHVNGPSNYGETAEWAGTKIFGRNSDGSDTFGLTINTIYNDVLGAGGTTKEANAPGSTRYIPTSTYSWPCTYYSSSNYVTAQVEAVPGSNSIRLDHWELQYPGSTQIKYDNPVQVPMTQDCRLVAVFANKLAPIAIWSYTYSDLTLNFDASKSTDPDGTIASYGWSFGDGGTAIGVSLSHSYALPGTYAITLTVTDNDGLMAVRTRLLQVPRSPDSPELWSEYDESSGTTASDSSGNGHAGTLHEVNFNTGGAFGNCIYSAGDSGGATNFVDYGNVLDITGDITISCWVKTTSNRALQFLVSKAPDTGYGRTYDLELVYDTVSGKYAVKFVRGNTWGSGWLLVVNYAAAFAPDGLWHFIAVRHATTGSYGIMVDGVWGGTLTSGSGVGLAASSGSPLLVGNLYPGGSGWGRSLQGYIDDVRIWDNSVSDTVINEARGQRLMLWSMYDESSGTTARDSSGNGLTGTLNGVSFRTGGAFGNCVYSDGTWSNRVNYGNVGSITGDITIACWVKTTSTRDIQFLVAKAPGTGYGRTYDLHIAYDTGSGKYLVEFVRGRSDQTNYLAYVRYSDAFGVDGLWHFIAARQSPQTGSYGIRVDGGPWGGTLVAGTGTGTVFSDNSPLDVGNLGPGILMTRSLVGYIDDVRIWNRYAANYVIDDAYRAGPKVWSKYDESSGTTASDSSGNGFTGTLNGYTSFDTGGRYGNCILEQENVANCVNYGNVLDITGDITIACWAKVTTMQTEPLMYVVTKAPDTGYSRTYDLHVSYNSGSGKYDVGFVRGNSAGTGWLLVESYPSAIAIDGQWHFIAARHNTETGSNGIMVDGVWGGTVTAGTWVGKATSTTAPLQVGNLNFGCQDHWNCFWGRLDEVRIWDRFLSDSELDVLGNRAPIASLIATPVRLTVEAEGGGSSDPDPGATVSSYAWVWGDGAVTPASSTPTARHTYAAAGTYTIQLTVTDDHGSTGTTSRTVSVAGLEPAGVMLWSKYDESSGTTASDSSGNGLTGTLQGVEFSTTGRYGNSVYSNGDYSDRVYYGGACVITGDITISCWVRISGFGMGTMYLVTKAYSTGYDRTYDLHLVYDNKGYYAVEFIRGNLAASGWLLDVQYPSAIPYNDGLWHFIAVRHNTLTGSFGIKVDDGPWGGTLVSGTGIGTANGGSNEPLSVGNFKDGAPYGPSLIGYIDDVRIWNRFLPASEFDQPLAAFTAAKTYLTANVDGSASASSSGLPVSTYAWEWGDGAVTPASSTRTATHTYAAAGSYVVKLTVTVDGETATTARTVSVTGPPNQPPLAAWTYVANHLRVSFDGSSSSDSDGTITSYAWNFGDGATGAGMATAHTYASGGTYVVSLTVTDDDGATTTATQSVTAIANQPPLAAFMGNSYSGLTGESLSFTASDSFDYDGNIVNYAWDWGDGATTSSSLIQASHSWVDNGVYNVVLTVTDDDGATGSTSRAITINNRLPVAVVTGPTTGVTGQALTWSASGSYDPDGSITRYIWSFTGGGNGFTEQVTHTFTLEGYYWVMVIVFDNDGGSAYWQTLVTISKPITYVPLIVNAGYYGAKNVWYPLTGSVTVDGISGTIGQTWSVDTATQHTVKVPDSIASGQKTYYMQKWESSPTTPNPGAFTFSTATTLRAVYTTTVMYKLEVQVNDASLGHTNPLSGLQPPIASGQTVSVTAYPNTGYQLSYWLLDGGTVRGNPYTVTMNSNHVLKAVFEPLGTPQKYTVTVQSVYFTTTWKPINTGTVTIGTQTVAMNQGLPLDGGSYAVTFPSSYKAAGKTYVFSYFEIIRGGVASGHYSNGAQVTVDADMTLKAYYVK